MVAAATVRTFRVLWYQTATANAFVNAKGGVVSMPKPKPKREATFEVKARTLDGARRAAQEYVLARMGPRRQLLTTNFTARPDELVIYTADKKENL